MARHRLNLLWAGGILLLLVLLYFAIKAGFVSETIDQSHREVIFHLEVATDGSTPPARFSADQGSRVRLVVRADQPGVIHLHGYEQEQPVARDAATTLTVTADRAGRFPIHWHGHMHADWSGQVAVLEVQPH